ncbi:phosphonoacetaldehyde dehydrogenase [Candidatus Woesearchaeota archaeon]|nr:phosphonoacetaldehyde dehydrogenase [Candidatus Woesearchaeota archaeon]|tara:strand:+ start:20742 stop:22163 length:1422 start_codon:yes stop_codon:yes gene_type:complete
MDMLINGKWESSGKSFDVINPYNNSVVDKVPIATKDDIKRALELSYKAKPGLSPEERADILTSSAKELKSKRKEFSDLITAESGLCVKQTLHGVDRSIDVLRESAKVALDIEKDITQRFVTGSPDGKPRLKVITEPLDLAVGITPFNHPLNQVAHKVCPAIAAGTCMVLKPTEKTPLAALKFGEILLDAGLPPNMLNIITHSPPKEAVDQMITHPLVEMVSFTGGVDVGKYIAKTMAANGKELAKSVFELGGNAAMTALDDADLDVAAKIGLNAFGNSGQRCTAIKRMLVADSIADEFIEKFMKLAEAYKYGDPMDPGMDMGTVIDEPAAIRIQDRVNKAIKEGAKLLYGNNREGALYSPTVLDNVNPRSELVVKETFGPVAPIIRVKDINEAIKIVNSVKYKLAGCVITESKDNAEKLANETAVGQFSWNGPPGYRTEHAPFGGFGDSGNYEKEGVILAAEGMRRIRTFYEH